MNSMEWLSLVPLGVMAACMLVSALIGLFRGIKKSLGSTIVIVLSFIVALIVTLAVFRPGASLGEKLTTELTSLFNSDTLTDIFSIDAVGNAIVYYAMMLAAPFAFTAIFFFVRLILGIVMRIVVKFIPLLNKCPVLVKKLGGAGVGLVNGFLIAVIIMMPLLGTVRLVDRVTDALVVEETNGQTSENMNDAVLTVKKVTTPLVNRGAGKVALKLGGGAMYDLTSSAKYHGQKITLEYELTNIAGMVSSVTLLAGDVTEYDDRQIDALDQMADGLENSAMLCDVASGILSEMAEKWLNDETFIGMEKIEAGEMMDPMIRQILLIFKTSDRTNIGTDFRTITDVFSVLIRKDVFRSASDGQALLGALSADGTVSDVLSAIGSNQRMSPLVDEVTRLSIRVLATTLNVPESMDENYDLLMAEMADVLADTRTLEGEARHEAVKAGLTGALEDYGVRIDGDAADQIADSVLQDLGDKETLSADDMKEFFAVYAAAQKPAAETSVFVKLSATTNETTDGFHVNEDGTMSLNGVILRNYTAETYMSSAAYRLAMSGRELGDVALLGSADTMVSDIVTSETINRGVKSFSNCSDTGAEAKKIEKTFVDLVEIVEKVGNESVDPAPLVRLLGPVLDDMCDTEIFGDEVTGNFLKAILQSAKISEALGVHRKEATSLADKMNASVQGTETYTSLTGSIADTIEVVAAASKMDLSKENRLETVRALMNSITPESAEVLREMATPSMIQSYGVSEENSRKSSEAVGSVLTNMANFKENHPGATQEDIDREAEAMDHLFSLAVDGSNGTGAKMFNSTDGETTGRLEMNAYDSVCLLTESVVMTDTLEDMVYGEDDQATMNPLGVEGKMNGQDTDELNRALDQYYDEHSDEEDVGRKLTAIAALFNLDKTFD